MRGWLALTGLLALASPVLARETRQSRTAEARTMTRQADDFIRANPRSDPGNPLFYAGTPWTRDWVLSQCRRSSGGPSLRACAAAARARSLDPR
ncbi:hypothetical protein [Paracraurococcus lichenis]|uniref:Uncharacterized protein n=1 Tax=Paracraurococcus lichenis TaxID=3064888 RepID=A0ABT9E9N5_9PROT|nr:hypothetical protein [Paracraurococcus sp. LOR1-02]MDO9712814.1 hypothetical protein [Paracraurococcus sp. LOR1-02]